MKLWQHDLCTSLDLRGRILVSPHGINGTVGGPMSAVKKYVRRTRDYPLFKDTDFKWSEGTGDDFPRLHVRERPEIVTFGVPEEIKVDEHGIVGGGIHLSPHQVNELVAMRSDAVFFDGRNAYEAEIGRFRGAIVPDVDTTPGFIAEIESGKYDHLKHRPIITYCTGGIRCEVLSVLMKNRGFAEVYQIDGGIVRYGETFGNKGLWEGSLYVFDGRSTVTFGKSATILGRCAHCCAPTDQFTNCANQSCRARTLLCESCADSNPWCADCSTKVGHDLRGE